MKFGQLREILADTPDDVEITLTVSSIITDEHDAREYADVEVLGNAEDGRLELHVDRNDALYPSGAMRNDATVAFFDLLYAREDDDATQAAQWLARGGEWDERVWEIINEASDKITALALSEED